MSDPLRTDVVKGAEDPVPFDRHARIEQLLLEGLDHYFAGRHEQAIDVWTRVAFLERGHDRARAYIERARTAIAERHRQAEELLAQGQEPLTQQDAGERGPWRELGADGNAQEMAPVLLERLSRLGPVAELPVAKPVLPGVETGSRQPFVSRVVQAAGGAVVLSWIFLAVIGVVTLVVLPEWFQWSMPAAGGVLAPPAEPLPVAHGSLRALTRARDMASGGHVRDALKLLERVEVTDPAWTDVQRLRADLQQQLLDLAPGPASEVVGDVSP